VGEYEGGRRRVRGSEGGREGCMRECERGSKEYRGEDRKGLEEFSNEVKNVDMQQYCL
jgi:hypothetical protein